MSSNKSRSISPRTSSSREQRIKSSRISRRHRTFLSMPFSEYPQHTRQPPSEVSFAAYPISPSPTRAQDRQRRSLALTPPYQFAFIESTVQSILVSIPVSISISAHGTNVLGRSHDSDSVGSSLQELRPSQRPKTSPFPTPATSSAPATLEVTESSPSPTALTATTTPTKDILETLVAKSRSSDCRAKSPHPHPSTTTRSFPLAVAAALRTKSLRRTHRRPRHPPPQRSLCANPIVGPHRNTNRLAFSDHNSPSRQPTFPTHTIRVSNRLERTIGIVRAVHSQPTFSVSLCLHFAVRARCTTHVSVPVLGTMNRLCNRAVQPKNCDSTSSSDVGRAIQQQPGCQVPIHLR